MSIGGSGDPSPSPDGDGSHDARRRALAEPSRHCALALAVWRCQRGHQHWTTPLGTQRTVHPDAPLGGPVDAPWRPASAPAALIYPSRPRAGDRPVDQPSDPRRATVRSWDSGDPAIDPDHVPVTAATPPPPRAHPDDPPF